MKKIVKNRKYDTETAQAICSRNVYSMKRVHYGLLDIMADYKPVVSSIETIYQKKSGEYFLYHEPTGNHECDYEAEIRPLTEESALDLCQKFMTGDEYEAKFGTVEE